MVELFSQSHRSSSSTRPSKVQPFAQERNQLRFVISFRLLKAVQCLTRCVQTTAGEVGSGQERRTHHRLHPIVQAPFSPLLRLEAKDLGGPVPTFARAFS